MKISASLYSNKEKTLTELVSELDRYNIDAFHIDSNDNLAVFDDISTIRKYSNTAIDLHIISEAPETFESYLIKHPCDWVCWQYETLPKQYILPELPNTKKGIAIMNDTPIDVFSTYVSQCDFILLMTTTPGKSGGIFNTETFSRIRACRKMFPNTHIHVDGGVNAEVSFILRDMGVYAAVSGSFLLQHTYMGEALFQLKTARKTSQFHIKDYMIPIDELPVLDIEQATFRDIVETMDSYMQGFVLLKSKDNTLAGITSNADLRRGILRNLDTLASIQASDIINTNPVCTHATYTTTEMLNQIQALPFTILFIPVLDAEKKLVGAITFNQLIKGES